MWNDPIVDEVRKTRERLAERFKFDVTAIFKDLRAQQATVKGRLIRRKRLTPVEKRPSLKTDSARLHPGR